MISLVVCSVNEAAFAALAENVAQTTGADHELIKIDNRENRYSIASAYNEGIKKANGNLVCFVHEDVKFLQAGWGKTVEEIFTDGDVGLLGVAGATYYPLPPIGWFSTNEAEVHIRQHFNRSTGEVKDLRITRFPQQKQVEAVVADGVFMVIPKRVLTEVSFDEKGFPPFHGYDADISLQIGPRYKVLLTKQIALEHFSEGNKNEDWHGAMKAVSRKWRHSLPRFLPGYSNEEKKEADLLALDVYFRDRTKAPDNFFQRLYRLFGYAARQRLIWEAVKIVLRYLLKKK